MKKKWLRTVLPIVVIVFLVLAGIWYTRPMTIAQLAPELDMEHPHSLYVHTRNYHVDSSGYANAEEEPLKLNLPGEDPRYQEFRSILENLRFRRTIKGLLTDLLDLERGTKIKDGMINWRLALQDSGLFELQFFNGTFYCIYCDASGNYEYNNFRECRMENHDEVAEALTSLILAYSTPDEGIN